MKYKTPLDRLAVDMYFEKVIKPQARKDTYLEFALPFCMCALSLFIYQYIYKFPDILFVPWVLFWALFWIEVKDKFIK